MKSRRLDRITFGAVTLILVGCGDVYLDGESDGGGLDKDSGARTSPDAGDPSKDAGGPPFQDTSTPDAPFPDSSLDVEVLDSSWPDGDDESDASGPGIPDAADDATPPFDVDVPDSAPAWGGGSPVAVATGQAPTSLVLDSTNLYWQNSSADPAIQYCPLTGCPGGTPTVISGAGNFGLQSFTVSQSIAYFFLGISPMLYEQPVAGGTATMVDSFLFEPPIFSNSTNFFTSSLDTINSCPVGMPCPTPTPTLYSVPSGYVTLVGLSSTEAYFIYTPADSEYDAALQAVPLSGGAARTVSASTLFSLEYIYGTFGTAVITTDYVYFTSGASLVMYPGGAPIYRVPTSGGDPVIYAIDDYPYGLAADDTNLYWTNSIATTGSVRACPLGAECTAPVTVAAGQDDPEPIVVNATTLYWGTVSAIYGASKSM